MATKQKVNRKKVEKRSRLPSSLPSSAKKKTVVQVPDISQAQESDVENEEPAGSQVSVREAAKENTTDNTRMDPQQTSTPLSGIRDQTGDKMSPKVQPEYKKRKKDHVEQKLDDQRTPSPSNSLATPGGRTRSRSPIRKNVVNPISGGGSVASMGSAVSVRTNASYSSLKEAWAENGNKTPGSERSVRSEKSTSLTRLQKSVSSTDRPSSSNTVRRRDNRVSPSQDVPISISPDTRANTSMISVREAPAEKKMDKLGLEGVKVDDGEEEDCPEKHAYIPYLYARNCIAKIMEDMKKMKNNHVVIVENIQHHYRTIEDDTQTQFNMFVICLREEYASKKKTFRQVIDLHRAELEQKEKYWNEMLASLAERNNRLLKEKKLLLVQNTTEIERLEKEKTEATQELTEKLDKLQAAPVPVPVPVGWEEEKKILEDQLASEKAENLKLQKKLSFGVTSPVVIPTETPIVESVAHAAAGTVVAAGALVLGKDDRRKMDKERKEMDEERQALAEERKAFEVEREEHTAEQKRWMGEISSLQEQLGGKNMETSEWKTKCDMMKTQLDDAAGIQAKYQALESQYAALALLVSAGDNKSVAQEQLQKTQDEKAMMDEEKQKMDKEINKWEKDFQKKNGRPPTQDDKSDSVKEMYIQKDELQFMVASLEKKEETFKSVKEGHVPDPPQVPPPVDTKEPKVVTVEVKVPDPTIVADLSKQQELVTTLRTEITTLHQEISDLNGEMSKQKQELSNQRARIADLENQLAALKAGGAVALTASTPSSSLSNEDVEELKKENRELRKDMKKMLKQYERMREMGSNIREGGDSGGQVEEMQEQIRNLDNKIADLESENEALVEERIILKERIKTEVITITHMEEKTKELEEKDEKLEDLKKELERLHHDNQEMQKDMKKMVKTHSKTKAKLDQLQGNEKAVHLLEIVAMMVHQIHSEVPDAATEVNKRLDEVENDAVQCKRDFDEKKMAADQWNDNFKKANGTEPGESDRDSEGVQLFKDMNEAKKKFKDQMLHVKALQLMKTGDVSKAVERPASVQADVAVENLEKALAAADNMMIDLEAEHNNVKTERDRLKGQISEMEKTIEDMKNQAQIQAMLVADTDSVAELTEQLNDCQKKCDGFEAALMQEKMAHVNTQEELENMKKQLAVMKEELENERKQTEVTIQTTKVTTETQIEAKEEEMKELKQRIETLEAERLSNLPPDTAKEIKELQDKLKKAKQEKSSTNTSTVVLQTQVTELTTKLDVANKNLEAQRSANRELEAKMKSSRHDKEKEVKKMSRHMEEMGQKRSSEDKNRINMLVKRVKELEAMAGKGGALAAGAAVGRMTAGGDKGLKDENMALKAEIKDLKNRIKQLEMELRSGGGRPGTAAGGADKVKGTRQEKILKELDKKMEMEKNKSDKLIAGLTAADEENKALKKELAETMKNLTKVQAELKTLGVAAKEGVEAATKVKELETDNKKLSEENKVLLKNFESERVLRKKYYNMVEDMKGKIRVYCRARPLSDTERKNGNKAVAKSADEYSISVETQRGLKDFQYDQVFMEDSTQEKIFEDTNNLIQSAVDGYNVCIFAYGQTGSGKTFTMIGDRGQNFPGIAPRAFNRIFELIAELKSKFSISVQAYMLELYNDRLIDLFAKPGTSDDDKLEIKKDKKGLVFVQGSVVKPATNAKELFALFEEGSANRHVASTKMNAESSRSHLVIGIIMESTNLNTGTVTKGKLSLVDLAGSERVAKTQAGADQLKEAMSINKSLSALGDVISALSSEQQFIPYRNNKLTMLMQDSLGGNAKTLMFVNISPADYNCDETVISLTYASRVKLITNDASKNADNKEIARLKAVIASLKRGDKVDEEDID